MSEAAPPFDLSADLAGGLFALGVHGLRGVLDIRAALRNADLREL